MKTGDKERIELHHHVKRLKKHRNVLYGLIIVLLVAQIVAFLVVSSQIGGLIIIQKSFAAENIKAIDDLKQDNQYKISELAREIGNQKSEIKSEINLLKVGQGDFSGVIDKAIKSVVSINTDKSAASGFFVHSGGYIVTNQHVVESVSFVSVVRYGGERYTARVVNSDAEIDLALLKVDGVFDHLEFALPEEIYTGQKVIAIGNPFGLSFTVTEGIISAKDRVGLSGLNSYVQTDVTLNPGNSGGPLINSAGKVVGVNNFKIGGAESLGFALESSAVESKVKDWIAQDQNIISLQ